MTNPPLEAGRVGPDSIPDRIEARGLVLIFAFWTFYGGAMSASALIARTEGASDYTAGAMIVFLFLGAYAWAFLTLPLLHLMRRLDLTGEPRWLTFAGLLVSGLVLSLAVSIVVALSTLELLHDSGWLRGRLATPGGTWVMVRYRFPQDLLACMLLLTAGLARDYFLRYQTRLAEANLLRSQLAEARLQVLLSQLNPHFLFNTLNAVAALVRTDPRGVRRMIALLSDMLRETLNGAEHEVPLVRELDLLRRYLAIMEIRFGGRLETRIDVDNDVLNALVPHLILQPLVENSIKHGVGPRSDAGRIDISARREGDELVLSVRDSGLGSIEREDEFAVHPDRGSGFGLRQTRERLWALYEGRGQLDLRSVENAGTVAEVRFPFHSERQPTFPADLQSVDPAATPSPVELIR